MKRLLAAVASRLDRRWQRRNDREWVRGLWLDWQAPVSGDEFGDELAQRRRARTGAA